MQPSSDIMSALSGVARDINSLDTSYLHLVVGVVDTAFVCGSSAELEGHTGYTPKQSRHSVTCAECRDFVGAAPL